MSFSGRQRRVFNFLFEFKHNRKDFYYVIAFNNTRCSSQTVAVLGSNTSSTKPMWHSGAVPTPAVAETTKVQSIMKVMQYRECYACTRSSSCGHYCCTAVRILRGHLSDPCYDGRVMQAALQVPIELVQTKRNYSLY